MFFFSLFKPFPPHQLLPLFSPLFWYTVVSGIVHHAVLHAACGQSREASSFIVLRLKNAKPLDKKGKEKKNESRVILVPLSHLFILQSVLIGVVILI